MLPRYDKNARRKSFEQLPKGAYVVKILNAVEEQSKNGIGSHIKISFDIAEGEYAGFYASNIRQTPTKTRTGRMTPCSLSISRMTTARSGCG